MNAGAAVIMENTLMAMLCFPALQSSLRRHQHRGLQRPHFNALTAAARLASINAV